MDVDLKLLLGLMECIFYFYKLQIMTKRNKQMMRKKAGTRGSLFYKGVENVSCMDWGMSFLAMMSFTLMSTWRSTFLTRKLSFSPPPSAINWRIRANYNKNEKKSYECKRATLLTTHKKQNRYQSND